MRVTKMYCDRCGKEFKNWEHIQEEKMGIIDVDDGFIYSYNHKDLCESCYAELEKWWGSGKNTERVE